ncbi:MAG: outer membrane protein assembly factor BamD [Bacteroidaceae bacterium]|nr:outer membrane protein assembly factor BamD [Bacteroidaceae bacterium]
MQRYSLILLFILPFLAGCGDYNSVMKTTDFEYKYEAAKSYYTEGNYRKASEAFGQVLTILKGTQYGDECLFMLGMSNYYAGDSESAAQFFKKYYQSYPKGHYVELSRYYCAMSYYSRLVDTRLDQSNTMDALTEFSNFLEYYPESGLRAQTQEMIFNLQDKLVEKEYLAAKLYYDLGTYVLNCVYGGSNYEACVITAQNALKDYPYASPERKEELSIMILRAKYHLARQSVVEKRLERFRDAVDEYYAFQNEFPESKYMNEAERILHHSERVIAKKGNMEEDEVEADESIKPKKGKEKNRLIDELKREEKHTKRQSVDKKLRDVKNSAFIFTDNK